MGARGKLAPGTTKIVSMSAALLIFCGIGTISLQGYMLVEDTRGSFYTLFCSGIWSGVAVITVAAWSINLVMNGVNGTRIGWLLALSLVSFFLAAGSMAAFFVSIGEACYNIRGYYGSYDYDPGASCEAYGYAYMFIAVFNFIEMPLLLVLMVISGCCGGSPDLAGSEGVVHNNAPLSTVITTGNNDMTPNQAAITGVAVAAALASVNQQQQQQQPSLGVTAGQHVPPPYVAEGDNPKPGGFSSYLSVDGEDLTAQSLPKANVPGLNN